MNEVELNQSLLRPIVRLHANTLEFFHANNGEQKSFHVRHIKSIEITADRKGKHKLVTTAGWGTFTEDVDDEVLADLKKLVAEVQQAMKAGS